ncbi:3-oxoacyl-[acyl-carrier protein] reductase [hydrothermal vent metagenome]|uniref:3-oxoacyl-[acyl-carrier protein] reductase n=1 Tax=hydrothermal vent metagenome TaxID=652676 RepID=A0A3B0VB20_9ZZZZ
MKLKNKCALVLGATRGIGLAVARELAANGVRLALPWFDWPEDSEAVRKEFGGRGAGHLVIETDLRDSLQVREMVERIAGEFGGLQILVNNIERGGMPVVHGSYEREVNRGQWQVEMETTLHAKWLVFEHCLPLLQKADQAAVVNISSIAGVVGRSGPAGLIFNDGYAAANRGISSLTETWARLGAPTIRVNEIMLGLIDTRHGRQTRGWKILAEKDRKELLAHTLLGRTGTPEEVAGAVMFLVRDADFMTGSVIRLDGGYILGGEAVPPMPGGVV